MENDGTYGGIQRSDSPKVEFSYNQQAGQLTLKMLEDSIAAMWRQGEEYERREREFYAALRPYIVLLESKDFTGYVAAYKLIRSGFYAESCLHMEEYKRYIAILKERGFDLEAQL